MVAGRCNNCQQKQSKDESEKHEGFGGFVNYSGIISHKESDASAKFSFCVRVCMYILFISWQRGNIIVAF